MLNTHLHNLTEVEGYTPEQIWRACRRVDPTLTRLTETLKPAFSKEDMRERYEDALTSLKRPLSYWKTMIYIDEFSVELRPRPRRFIGRKGSEQLRTDKRCKHHPKQIKTLHVLLAVCYATGLVCLLPLAHCAGYTAPRTYYVSPAAAPTHLQHLDAVQQPIGLGVDDAALGGGAAGQLGCVLQLVLPKTAVKVVQAHQAAPLPPRLSVFLAVSGQLLARRGFVVCLGEVLLAVHLHLHPAPLLPAAAVAATAAADGNHHAEVEGAKSPPQHLGFGDDGL